MALTWLCQTNCWRNEPDVLLLHEESAHVNKKKTLLWTRSIANLSYLFLPFFSSLLFSASVTPVVFIMGSKAAVMRQSIFLGELMQSLPPSRWLPASPLAVLQQVEGDQSGEDLRDAAGGETDEVL